MNAQSLERKINICIIGADKQSCNLNLIRFIKSNQNWCLVSICGFDTEKLKSDLEIVELDVQEIYNDVFEFLKNRPSKLSINIAILSVEMSANFGLINRLLNSSVNVILENCFKIEIPELKELIDAANLNSMKIASLNWSEFFIQELCSEIGHVYSFHAKKTLKVPKKEIEDRQILTDAAIPIVSLSFSLFGEPKKIDSNVLNSGALQMILSWSDSGTNINTSGVVVINNGGLMQEEVIEINGTQGYIVIRSETATLYNLNGEIVVESQKTPDNMLLKRFKYLVDWMSGSTCSELDSRSFLDLSRLKSIYEIFNQRSLHFRKEKYDYDWPRITKELEDAVIEQMHSSLSLKIDRAEMRNQLELGFKEYLGAEKHYSILCNSGTMAIFTMYRAIQLMPNDLIIVPVYTFHATVSPMMHYGAIPIFCDSDENGNIDPLKLENLCYTLPKKPKAVIVTHMWGAPANMKEIVRVCKNIGCYLLEDCSHAHGASIDGKMVGTFGDAAAWSLQCQKILTAGEGGILLLRDKEMYYKALLSSHFNKPCAMEIDKDHELYKFYITGTGLKLRIHPLGVAIANQQLKCLKNFIEVKNYFAAKIVKSLSAVQFLKMPKLKSCDYSPSWYAFIMHFVQNKAPKNITRESFCQHLKDAGLTEIDIPNATILIHTQPLYNEPYSILPHVYGDENSERAMEYKVLYEKCQIKEYTTSANFRATAIKMPVWAFLDQEHIVDRYINTICNVANKITNISNDQKM